MPGKKVLLVEGTDDMHVMMHICGTRDVGKLDEIKDHGGVNSLIESFPVRLKESDTEALGVVLDADTDVSSRWHSLRDRLRDAGYDAVPETPVTGGTVVPAPPSSVFPRVGVWIMPDNVSPGILEDFLRFLVPSGSPLFQHVEASVSCISPGQRLFRESDLPKVLIHTWLTWQAEPGKPLGTAITARYLDPGVPQVDVLVTWLRNLFFPSAG